MAWWNRKKAEPDYRPSKAQKRNFAAAQNRLVFDGWDTSSNSIDSYLRTDLPSMRARSREQTKNNPMLKRAVGLQSKNIVGAKGIMIQPKVSRANGELDKRANDAIKAACKDWGDNYFDYAGKLSFIEMQSLWTKTAAIDGEFVAIIHNTGKYGLQVENVDPELLDCTRNQKETSGNVTRLGVEYSGVRVVALWFRTIDEWGNYSNAKQTRIPADRVLHCFINDWPNQSRGIPWSYASLSRLKHIDAFDDSLLTAARAGASKMGFITGGDDDEELDGGVPIMDFNPGTITKLGEDEEWQSYDPTYPDSSYAPFAKKAQRDVGAGMDLSYASLSGDMSDVNYSSIRYGGQDERDGFIEKQNWLIRSAIKPIYEMWVRNAVLRGQIKIGTYALSRPVTDYYAAAYQGRKWLSTDPQKEAKGNALDLENGLTSPQRIITARGDDPDEIAAEIKEWQAKTGISYEQKESGQN